MKLFYWHYGIIVCSLATAILHIICYPYFGWGDKTFNFETTAAIGYYAKVAEMFLLIFMGFDLPMYLPAQAKNRA